MQLDSTQGITESAVAVTQPILLDPVSGDATDATVAVGDPVAGADRLPDPAEDPLPGTPLAESGSVLDELRALRHDFELKLQYDLSKDRIAARLHAELEEHRRGLHFTLLRPIFTDLIALHDDLLQVVSFSPGGTDVAMHRNLESFAETVEEILLRQGVSTYSVEDDQFDSKRQRTSRRVATAEPALERRVAERLRRGFEYEGRVLRPELVATFYLDATAAAAPAETRPTEEER